MDKFQKHISAAGGRNVRRIIKKGTAFLLALALVFSSAANGLTITAMAADMTELQSAEEMKVNGGGLTTAYMWDQSNGHFDIEGIEDASKIGADKPYTGDREHAVITTYRHHGYETVVRKKDDAHSQQSVTISKNGGVQTFDSLGIEVQMKVYPSLDQKWILVDYIAYNKLNADNPIQIASGTDVQVGGRGDAGGSGDPADASTLTADTRGFHMVNEETQQTFDCVYSNKELKVTEPDSKWVGWYNARKVNYFTDGPHSVKEEDSGLTYSWTIPLRPYETAVRRVAFAAKGPSYYVSDGGNDSAVGAYNTPLKTLEGAIAKIGNNVGYIYIQDYGQLTSTVTVPSGANITFMSSDYNKSGKPISNIITISRAAGLTSGPMFKTEGGTMRFSNLVLDGSRGTASGNTSPILSADSGTVGVMRGAVLQNNQVNAAGKGSAIQVSGNGNLEMNYGTVTGNTAVDRGAVNFESTGKFTVQNIISITGNTLSGGEKANVYLAPGKQITVAGDLDASVIGVTTGQLPDASAEGNSTKASQEIKVAVPLAESVVDISPSPFMDNFTVDQDQAGTGLYITSGTAKLDGAGEDNDRNTVLKKNGYRITSFVKDASTGGGIMGAPEISTVISGSGETVELAAPPAVSGYELTGVTIDQGDSKLLQAQLEPGENFGKVTGSMPNQDVTIDYEYSRVDSGISFVTNGGTPQPPTLTGMTGSAVNAMMPRISRYGYVFRGWSPVNGDESNIITKLPEVYPDSPVTYYAVFKPDSNVKFSYTVEYSNQTGDTVFRSDTEENAYSVETPVQAGKKDIHGYAWSPGDSGTTPAEYNYSGTSEKVGEFDGSTGDFTGIMPGQDVTVRYRYRVDYGNEAAQSLFTVRHETAAGTQVSAPQTSNHYPEETVTARPVTKYGYECTNARIDTGTAADSADGHLVSALLSTFDEDRVFRGVMPNQPVTVTYLYEPTEEGYPLTVEYLDNGTSDERLKNIREPLVHLHQADEAVGLACAQGAVEYREPYGYSLAEKAVSPSTPQINWSGNDFTGTMPNDSVTVAYSHSRVPELWADITYRAGIHGSLTAEEGMSSDVQAQDDGSYKAVALIDNTTAQGAEFCYTLGKMKEKRLMPGTGADQYYRFAGWFVDTNRNGLPDDGETLLEEGHRFTGAVQLTAAFLEDPSKWVDIRFEAGDRGSINEGETLALHANCDTKWKEITGSLPHYTPEVNYLPDGWYAGETAVTGEMVLTDGQVYTIRFRQDPGVFGIDVAQPETLAGLNTRGKGRITAFSTTTGYQYILTDPTGKILEVIRGDELTGRAVFDGLYPGAEYRVYESGSAAPVLTGGQIEEAAGPLSAPAETLTPVLETNYRIDYDEKEEGKTTLTVIPADGDSEYAALDDSGHVVVIPSAGNGGFLKPSGSPASLTFTGLAYNREYTVVARPLGRTDLTAESLSEKGSVITTDPGGEPKLLNYTVETQNGEIIQVGDEAVGDGKYGQAHKGDLVKITAEAENRAGEKFSHWDTTIGKAGKLEDITGKRETEFTMPAGNVVLTAVYKRPKASPSNAEVVDEVRGASRKETALDPNEIPRLEGELTTAADKALLNVNRADVTYRVVYRKNAVKATESNAVKASVYYETEHEAAYKGAWGMDVLIERYVNGRKVTGDTEPAASFRTYIQMEKDGVDMLDYQLYEITENPGTGETEASPVALENDPEKTGGLYAFTACAGSRYVMVYNRAYRLCFINNRALPLENRYRYSFKVRRDEAPEDEWYREEYGQVAEQLESFVSPDGAEHQYEGWSRSQDSYEKFDPTEPLRRKTCIYASYKDNVKNVDDAREKLEEAIRETVKMSDDHFLKQEESGELKDAVEKALEVLDRRNPKATESQLNDALEKLNEKKEPYDKILDDRYEHYDKIQENGNNGGNKGGGGSGRGTKSNPFQTKRPESYVVGTNGNWVEVSAPEGEERQIAFVLNGGMRLSGMWAWIRYPADESGKDSDRTGWYHFHDNGIMETGWISDKAGNWYYCSTEKEGSFGKMQTGWRHDGADGNWYYLIPESGVMVTGWRKIGEKWYYFETAGAGVYTYDPMKGRWSYGGGTGKPLGSMYKNEMTPDGFQVGDDGAWDTAGGTR